MATGRVAVMALVMIWSGYGQVMVTVVGLWLWFRYGYRYGVDMVKVRSEVMA